MLERRFGGKEVEEGRVVLISSTNLKGVKRDVHLSSHNRVWGYSLNVLIVKTPH